MQKDKVKAQENGNYLANKKLICHCKTVSSDDVPATLKFKAGTNNIVCSHCALFTYVNILIAFCECVYSVSNLLLCTDVIDSEGEGLETGYFSVY